MGICLLWAGSICSRPPTPRSIVSSAFGYFAPILKRKDPSLAEEEEGGEQQYPSNNTTE